MVQLVQHHSLDFWVFVSVVVWLGNGDYAGSAFAEHLIPHGPELMGLAPSDHEHVWLVQSSQQLWAGH